MNRRITLLLLTFFIVNIINSQDYYWSNNSKIPILKNYDKVLVKATEGSPTELSITRQTSIISEIKRISQNSILVELKKDTDKDNLFRFTENMISSFKNESGEEMIPTGEVLFKPKKGYGFDDINRITNGSLELVREKYGCFTAIIKDYRNLITVSNNIYESGLVEYSHPNFIAELIRDQNDPLYPDQYYLNNTGQFGGTVGVDINAPQAWAITTGLTDIRVAVIDDGVENHVDINGRVVQGYTPTNPTGFGAPAFNSLAHGQACAGIIGASRNNNEGIAGIAPCVDIVPVNIFEGNPSTAQVANAIDWAWDEGDADVLSNSWSYPGVNTYYDNIAFAIGRARSQGRDGKGSIVVFSSGNYHPDGNDPNPFVGVAFPGRVSGVLTVGAITNNGNIQPYSSRGTGLDIVAPSGGGNVRTTDFEGADGQAAGDYRIDFGGTSAACPQVAGVAALMLSFEPTMTESQIKTRILNSATGVGYNTTTGNGRLNAQAALQQITPIIDGPNEFCPSATMQVGELSGGTITWSVSPSNALSFTQGQSTTTFTRIGGFTGSATISATLNPACGTTRIITKNVNVDVPPIDNVSFTNSADGEEYLCTSHYGNMYEIYPNISGATYQYRLRRYPNLNVVYTSPTGQFNTGTINYIPPQGFYEFQVRSTNACGTSSWTGWEVEFIDCSQGFRSSGSTMVYPNPTSTRLYFKRSGDNLASTKQKEPFRAELYDLSGILVEEYDYDDLNAESSMEVSKFNKGNYFLKIIAREIEDTHQIIIE